MSDSLLEFLDSAKNLTKVKKYYAALENYEEILKAAFNEEYDQEFFNIFDQTLNQIRIIASELKYKDAEEISTLYDEFLMKQGAVTSYADKAVREQRIKNQYLSAANDFINHVHNLKESLSQTKVVNNSSSKPLFVSFTVGAIAASVAAVLFTKIKK